VSTLGITALYLSFFYFAAGSFLYQELLFFYIILGFFNAIYFCTAPAEIISALPNRMRSTVNGLLYGIPAIIFGALSLPYFQTQFQKNPESPLIILAIAIPLIFYCCRNSKSYIKASHDYTYPLEKTKVS
jgi:ABC-type phosphate transport system permease subunit